MALNQNEANVVVKARIDGQLKDIRISEMTDSHRTAYKRTLLKFANDRKDGLKSPWYDTGKTIGELVSILERAASGVEKKVYVRGHYRTVR